MPGRSEASEREALAALSSCPNFQHHYRSQNIMYIAASVDPIYHLARDDRSTLCLLFLNPPDKRKRYDDKRFIDEIPANKVCALCSECASLAGDTRSFDERVSYPSTNS